FPLFKQSGINYPPTSSVPLSFKKGASFFMLSFNQLSHACPLQEENIWYPDPYLKLDKGKNADCLVTIIPEQQHAFLHSNIEDSTFHHQPAKTGLSIVWKSKIS
ncbi:hypothetical protein, partial [Dialister histaminiformans]|uniref:hypothetical protein n=1 Tax=Allisonella histaminiformans TaxID=209880 RepID=UPI001F3A3E94